MSTIDRTIVFMIVTFSLAIIMIWKKESVPDRLRRPLAIATLVMVSASFVMLVVSLFKMD